MDISDINEIFGPDTGLMAFASGIAFLLGCLVLGLAVACLKNLKEGIAAGLGIACLIVGLGGAVGLVSEAIDARETAEQQYSAAFQEHYGITITSEEARTVVRESTENTYKFTGQRDGDAGVFLAETHGEGDGMTLTVYEKVDDRYVDVDRVK